MVEKQLEGSLNLDKEKADRKGSTGPPIRAKTKGINVKQIIEYIVNPKLESKRQTTPEDDKPIEPAKITGL